MNLRSGTSRWLGEGMLSLVTAKFKLGFIRQGSQCLALGKHNMLKESRLFSLR